MSIKLSLSSETTQKNKTLELVFHENEIEFLLCDNMGFDSQFSITNENAEKLLTETLVILKAMHK